MGNVLWSKEPEDNLIRDLGALIAARDAMRLADDVANEAIDKAVRGAGVAVSRTINRSDPDAVIKAREAIADCRDVIEALKFERERARAAVAKSVRLSERSENILVDIRTAGEERARRGREQN